MTDFRTELEHAAQELELAENALLCSSFHNSAIRVKAAARRARAALAQSEPQGPPAIEPVPVSEQPWERKRWCDANGKCWWFIIDEPGSFPYWIYAPISAQSWAGYQASLPHWALPTPTINPENP